MKTLSAEELRGWMNTEKEYLLVDVRELDERAAYNIGGIHIPMNEIMSRKDELSGDKPVVLYCEKGIRSAIIIQRLEAQGFHMLYNLEGGMNKWKNNNPKQ